MSHSDSQTFTHFNMEDSPYELKMAYFSNNLISRAFPSADLAGVFFGFTKLDIVTAASWFTISGSEDHAAVAECLLHPRNN